MQSSDQKTVDSPPNGGYGWVCVACCFWINAHTWGVNSSYGVFLAYYLQNNYYPGASALEFAFVGGLSISLALVLSPVATLTTRLYGTNVTLLIGVFFETLALIGASFTRRVWHLFLSQGICFGLGLGFLFVGSVCRAQPENCSPCADMCLGGCGASMVHDQKKFCQWYSYCWQRHRWFDVQSGH